MTASGPLARDKLLVRRLEVTSPPITDGGRMRGAAGEFAQISNGEPFPFVAYLDFAGEGTRRGDHFHERKTELLYVIDGELDARYLDLDTQAFTRLTLEAGHLVRVGPRCAHAYVAARYSQAVELATLVYDPSDTFPTDLLSH